LILNFNIINHLHFYKILFTQHNAKNISKTVISGNEQNLNKQMDEFRIIPTFSKLLVSFGQTRNFFKVLKTDLQFSTFNPMREPCLSQERKLS